MRWFDIIVGNEEEQIVLFILIGTRRKISEISQCVSSVSEMLHIQKSLIPKKLHLNKL